MIYIVILYKPVGSQNEDFENKIVHILFFLLKFEENVDSEFIFVVLYASLKIILPHKTQIFHFLSCQIRVRC